MWTPRRLLLLLAGFAAFGAAYTAYALVLGGIDGLPPLPAEFLARRSADDDDFHIPLNRTMIDAKLQVAFGNGCPEIHYNHKLELGKRGIVLASNHLTIEPDGRCKLTPLSMAVFKDRGPNQAPEVNTVRSDVAYILFDKPVATLTEMGQRRIAGCDLHGAPELPSGDPRHGRIQFTHNRATFDPDDDLAIETAGPVTYRDRPAGDPRPHVVTEADVTVIDRRGTPQATTITATGLALELIVAAKGAAGPKPGGVSGVKRVSLKENVVMNLWVDPKAGFLATGPAAPAAPAERSNVSVKTRGPFTYEVGPDADTARFVAAPSRPGATPETVEVTRPVAGPNGEPFFDRLYCDELVLRFAHRAAGESARPGGATGSDLKSAHARGPAVVLMSDAERLLARGTELDYDAAARETTLRGQPDTVALRDDSEIHAPELVLGGGDNGVSRATARGAGRFRARLTPANAAEPRDLTATWREQLVYAKLDGQDVITLTGSAVVEDREHEQILCGDQIKLWLARDPGGRASPADAAQVRPKRLEVTGHVLARSPEMHVHDSDLLVLMFRERPTAERPAAPASTAPPPAEGLPPAVGPEPARPTTAPPKPRRPEKPPLDLAARSVQATLDSVPGQPSQLEAVYCEGAVRVKQESARPGEKPIDLRGQALQLHRRPEGHILSVIGDPTLPAEVHLPELSLLGPTVRIDQVENVAEVIGPGTMRMQSTTDLQGQKLAKPTDLFISWSRDMHFNGRLARFHGHVQADQDPTRLLCHSMQVTLDRPVSLSQAKPGEPRIVGRPANVDKVLCESSSALDAPPVSVVEAIKAGGRLTRYQRIESRELAVFKSEGKLEAPGRGEVRLLQPGPRDSGLTLPGARKPAAAPPGVEMKLTWVRYDGRMAVDQERKTGRFWRNVEVLHLPADDPGLHRDMDQLIDRLPPGAIYIRCELLTVQSSDRPDGRKAQLFHAEQRAEVQADTFEGKADVIKFDEEKQQVIFEGRPGNPAVLFQYQGRGVKPKSFRGTKFVYSKATNEFTGVDVISIQE